MNIHILPSLNALLNGFAFIFLFLAWRAIKRQKRDLHRNLMICALICSVVFLISYLTYHALIGVTRYPGQGLLRTIYFLILGTHTPLAVLILPFIGMALWYAFKNDFTKHVRITKWLLPVWMYVSVTGVVIYVMLYVL